MKLFEPLQLKFQQADWANNPEFGLMDTILDHHPGLLNYVAEDITEGNKCSDFGRQAGRPIQKAIEYFHQKH
ncbi:hypothetical protein [Paraflavitalea speifideaquila]|uniref:hypothetical protein n=1 Tax=Paraflavitalea speifideaquila TaxID=3076558 RepID=UPI003CCCE6C1